MNEPIRADATAELILIRHPHTQANAQGDQVQMAGGRTDSVLTALGIGQAARLCGRLRTETSPSAIYSSPLGRAAKLAQLLSSAVGKPVCLRPRLREIDCGIVDGLPLSEVKRIYAHEWQTNLSQKEPDFRWPGGESYREFRERCVAEIKAIAAAHAGERVFVVTHAGVISQVCGHLQGTSPAQWELYRPGNTSLTEIHWGPEQAALMRFDDQEHLGTPAADLKLAS